MKKWTVNDGIKWDGATPDFVADAEEMLRKMEEEQMESTEDDVKPDHRAKVPVG